MGRVFVGEAHARSQNALDEVVYLSTQCMWRMGREGVKVGEGVNESVLDVCGGFPVESAVCRRGKA